jgi:hypothetical protein
VGRQWIIEGWDVKRDGAGLVNITGALLSILNSFDAAINHPRVPLNVNSPVK